MAAGMNISGCSNSGVDIGLNRSTVGFNLFPCVEKETELRTGLETQIVEHIELTHDRNVQIVQTSTGVIDTVIINSESLTGIDHLRLNAEPVVHVEFGECADVDAGFHFRIVDVGDSRNVQTGLDTPFEAGHLSRCARSHHQGRSSQNHFLHLR